MQSPHSTPEELAAFSLGKLRETDSGEILEHLGDCEDCRSTIDNLADAGDTLASALRRPVPTDELAEEPELQLAIAKIHQLGQTPSVECEAAADPATQPLLGAVRDYDLIGLLGRGGMGAVYKARHRRLKRVVALKVLPASRTQDASAVARFHREMEAVGRLDHPHIVRAMDAGEDDGKSYLVMEYVRGVDLSQIVKQRGALSPAEACELVRQAAIGLQEAHEHGMVHRDIKPSNLMLAMPKKGPPIVKILDMGLAQLTHAAGGEELTSTGQLMGTLDYMAPEQGGDTKAVDIRADIYALGATLYKLLTGEPVYHGERYEAPMQKMMALATESAPPILEARSDIPPELATIVHRMLEKEPEARFATPADVAAALMPFCRDADPAELLASIGTDDLLVDDQSLVGTSPAISASESETQPTVPAEALGNAKAADAKQPPRSGRRYLMAAMGGFAILLAGWITIKIRKGDQETVVKVPAGAEATVDDDGSVSVDLAPSRTKAGNATADSSGESPTGKWIHLLADEQEFAKWKKADKGVNRSSISFNEGDIHIRDAMSVTRNVDARRFVLHGELSYTAFFTGLNLNFGDVAVNLLMRGDKVEVYRTGGYRYAVRAGGGVPTGTWVRFHVVFDDGQLTLFQNGEKIHSLVVKREQLTRIEFATRLSSATRWRNVGLLNLTDAQAKAIRAGMPPEQALPAFVKITPADAWVDLLVHVDTEQGPEAGDWWFAEQQALTVIPPNVKSSVPLTARLALPCVPRGSYELRTRFRRLDVKQQGIGIHLPVFGSSTWLMHGKKSPLTFAHGVDPAAQGLPADLSLEFLAEKELRIRVDRAGDDARLALFVENVPLFTWKGDPKQLAPPDFVTVKSGGLGIGAAGRYTIEKFELRMLDGEAELFPRPQKPRPPQKKSPPDYEPLAKSDWIEIPLEEIAAQSSQASVKDSVLELRETTVSMEEYAARDMLLRAQMRLVHGWNATLHIDKRVVWANADGGFGGQPSARDVRPRYQPHEWFELTLASVGDRMVTFVDGVQIHDTTGQDVATGPPRIGTQGIAHFRKIEVMPLDDMLPEGEFPGGWKEKAVLRHKGPVTHLAFSPTQPHLATISADRTTKIWDLTTLKAIHTIKTESWHLDRALAYSPNGKLLMLAAGGKEQLVKLWNVEEQRVEDKPLGLGTIAGAFSPDGKTAAIAQHDRLRLIDVATRKELWNAKTGNINLGARCVAFSPDGRRVATGGGADVDLWDAKTADHMGRYVTYNGGRPVNSIAFSPEGNLVAVGSDDRVLFWFDASKMGKHIHRGGHPDNHGAIQGVAFSPDGSQAAYAGDERVVRVCLTAHGQQEVTALRGHEGTIMEVAFSPDGQLLASCDWGGAVRLWEVPPTASVTPKDGWLDLLPLVERQFDAKGPWRRYGSGWRVESGNSASLNLPVQPDESSSFEIETVLPRAATSRLSFTWPDAHGMPVVSPFNDGPAGLCAAGRVAEDTTFLQKPRFAAPKDEELRLHLKVFREGEATQITATLNDQPWLDWRGPSKALKSGRRSAQLYFSHPGGDVWIKSARLRMLEGEARLLRRPNPKPSEALPAGLGEPKSSDADQAADD